MSELERAELHRAHGINLAIDYHRHIATETSVRVRSERYGFDRIIEGQTEVSELLETATVFAAFIESGRIPPKRNAPNKGGDEVRGTTLAASYSDQLDCGQGCSPAFDNDMGTCGPLSREGELWVCHHGVAYQLYWKGSGWAVLHWRRLGPWATRQARKTSVRDD